jgi:hypothetical protein
VFGARDAEVGEPLGLLRSEPVLQFELEAYPEAKLLSQSNINDLISKYGTSTAAAKIIGDSEAFVRQNS